MSLLFELKHVARDFNIQYLLETDQVPTHWLRISRVVVRIFAAAYGVLSDTLDDGFRIFCTESPPG